MSEPSAPEATPEALALPDVAGAAVVIDSKHPSLLGNSFARLGSDIWTLAMSLVAATITARALGPAGKGFYSTLILLAGAFMFIFTAGLPEAAVVLAGRGRFSFRDAASATMTAILPLSVMGTVVFIVVATWALQPSSSNERVAVLIGGAQVGVMVWYMTVTWWLIAQERMVAVAAMAITLASGTTLGVLGLVAWAHFGQEGAVLGGLVGALAALLLGLAMLVGSRSLPSPKRVTGFLPAALRLGAHFQVSNLLVTLTARLDLLLVYHLQSASVAGSYSVALTIGALVGAAPVAVAYASFPRLTRLDDSGARELTTQLFRMGVATAMLAGATLAILTPIAIPLVFGSVYKPAIAPTLLVIPAGVLSSAQWLLCRARAARGEPQAMAVSFTASFVLMMAVDFVLVPPFGAVGAGIGTLVASTAGFVIAAIYYRDCGWGWKSFVPGISDLSTFVTLGRRVLQAGRPERSPKLG